MRFKNLSLCISTFLFISLFAIITGTPLAILDRAITVGTVSNVYSDCDATATSSFNPSSGIMQLTYNVEEFTRNPNCTNTTTPEMFGYKSFLRTNDFDIKIDVRSIFTTVALNSGIAFVENLQVTLSTTYNHTVNGVSTVYKVSNFVDPQFPGMSPVSCLFPKTNDRCASC
jgi:hypothetical protein